MGPNKLRSSPPLPLPDLETVIKELTKGRVSANLLRAMLQGHSAVDSAAARVLLDQILATLATALNSLDPQVKPEASDGSAILQGDSPRETGGAATKSRTQSSRRGGYRRRAYPYEIKRITAHKIDDGRSWRKYGQKEIYNAKFPRSYFRCTHKHDQGCPATRQVQRSEDDPSLYEITYIGSHTCKDPSETIMASSSRDGCLINFAVDQREAEASSCNLTTPGSGSSSSGCFVPPPPPQSPGPRPPAGTECEHGDVTSGLQMPDSASDLDMEGLMGESFDQFDKFDDLLFGSFL